MSYNFIWVVEISTLLLIFLAGFRVHQHYAMSQIKPIEFNPNIETETIITSTKDVQEKHLLEKNHNTALNNYIGDFF
jgi:hypothetical protein